MAALIKFHDEMMAEFAATHRLLDEILKKPKQSIPDEGHPGPGSLRPFLIDDDPDGPRTD